MRRRREGTLSSMTGYENKTADDTTSAAGGPPEAGGLPVEDVAPDVAMSEVTAPDDAGGDAGSAAGADDFNADAAAPEPTD